MRFTASKLQRPGFRPKNLSGSTAKAQKGPWSGERACARCEGKTRCNGGRCAHAVLGRGGVVVAFPHISHGGGRKGTLRGSEGRDALQVMGGVRRWPVRGRHAAAGVLVDVLVGPVQAAAAHGPRLELGRRLGLRRRPGDVARAAAQRRGPRERRRPRARRGRLRRVPRVQGRAARRSRREAAFVSVGHAGFGWWPHELLGALRTLTCQLRGKSRLRCPSHARFLWWPHVVARPARDCGRS